MNTIQYPSKLLKNAVLSFTELPGIGQKTALRLVLHLLRQPRENVENFGHAIVTLRSEIKYCKKCHNISDTEICDICSNKQRQTDILCVVENVQDVMAIENTQQYKGLYHVLGGVISPMDGISPGSLEIESLAKRILPENIREVILALSTTMEGDTTNFYIYKKIAHLGIKITTIARGIAVGDELEYADEITLGRSILNRIDFNFNKGNF
ncbi:MAG: recombination mediator RecR [Prevotellaceae bacterium]|jgi:recombination protein RecR|nr:recombination mediator RecR [Prevotellaceae bacterium]